MKGCARTCLLWLLGWAAAAYAFYFYFVTLHDFGPPMYFASIGTGLCVIVSIGYALGIGTAHRERKMLLDAVSGTPPPDGQWVAVSGTIRSLDPLRAPISGKDAVAYQYKISRSERTGKNTTEVTYFDGKALAPSTISTRQGTVRLLAVPSLDVEPEAVPNSEAVSNAREYVRQTHFQSSETPKERTNVEEESTDDDGQYRLDKRYSTRELDLTDGFRFEERAIRNGETVCAFGLYSTTRSGLVPHPNWAKQTRLMRGGAEAVADQLRKRILRYFTGIVIFSAIAYGIVRFYRYNADKLTGG